MKKFFLILIGLLLTVFSAQVVTATEPPLAPDDYSWMQNIRQEHPRMFLTKADIPYIRNAALTYEKRTFDAMKKRVDSKITRPIEFPDPLVASGEGKENRHWGFYAADAAMVYLVTKEPQYLDFTKRILKELTAYYQLRVQNNLNIEWYCLTQICAMCAYDWIYNDLSIKERESFGSSLFNVMCDIAWHGPGIREPRFRENISDHESGCYGITALPWYIGLTFWKEGFDDSFCEDMVRNGYNLNQKMTAFRSQMLGKNGGGASGVPGYALAVYPYAEYDFMYTFQSATGIDISQKLDYMIGYLNYMDWIRLPGNKEYGFGDCNHYKGSLPHQHMNAHVAEIANLFGKTHPEILPVAARLLNMFTVRRAMDMIPFMRLLHKINPLSQSSLNIPQQVQPKAMYFDTMGQLYMRSGTGDDDTYVLFVSGGVPRQHKHYDNNNFIIYKHGYRALDSGTRPEPGWHLPYYYARTVAHNCVTIKMPGEVFPKYWGGPAAVEDKTLKMPNDGGQCDILGSKLLELKETEDYVYVASDASECYHKDKAELVMREFIWCVPDVFVVFDRVVSDKPEYSKRWLYHTAAEPKFKGTLEFSERSQGGVSICRTLFPADARLEKIGGPGKQFWSDGRNWEIPVSTPADYGYAQRANIPPNDYPLVGQWRVEVKPGTDRTNDVFMHIIQVGDQELNALPKTKTFENDSKIGVEFKYNGKKFHIAFDKTASYGCDISVSGKSKK